MNKPVIIRKIGNSLGVTISDFAKELGLKEGDRLYASRTPRGIELARYDADFETAVDAARAFMRKYPNAMKTLAE